MTLKIEILGQNLLILADLRGHFDHFGGQKSRFFDFFKVVLDLLRLGTVWALFSASKGLLLGVFSA